MFKYIFTECIETVSCIGFFLVYFDILWKWTAEVGLTARSRQQTFSTAHTMPASLLLPNHRTWAFQQKSQHNLSHCKKATHFPTAVGKILGESFRTRIIPSRADLRVNISQMISSAELNLRAGPQHAMSCTPLQAAIPSSLVAQVSSPSACRSSSHEEHWELFLSNCRAVF